MFWVKSSWTFKNIQELKNRNISSRQDAFTSMQVKIYDMYKLYNISLGNLKTLTFLSPEHDVTLFVRFYPRSSVRYISMFGIRVEWKDTKRFTWFCVTQYFDSRFLIWYSWFDSSETQQSRAQQYRRQRNIKESTHAILESIPYVTKLDVIIQ